MTPVVPQIESALAQLLESLPLEKMTKAERRCVASEASKLMTQVALHTIIEKLDEPSQESAKSLLEDRKHRTQTIADLMSLANNCAEDIEEALFRTQSIIIQSYRESTEEAFSELK